MTEKELVTKMLDTLVKSRKELANIDLGITKKSLPDLDKIIEHIGAPLMIMVMGEFSTGKSTFINAMVGEEVTAVNATPTTAVITKLCYGLQDRILVHFTDGTKKEYELASFKQLTSKAGTESEDKTHENIEYVERQMPLDMLQYVTIIDSPGLNDVNEKHSATTKKFVSNADTVLWMFSSLQSGSKTEVDAMESLTPRLKPIAIVNKMDELDVEEEDPQEFLDNLRVQLKDKVQTVVGISAKYALEGKLEKNETKIDIGNLKELEQVVRELVLPNRDKYKLNTLMDELGKWIADIVTVIKDKEKNNQVNKDNDYESYLANKARLQQNEEVVFNIANTIKDYCIKKSESFNEQALFFVGVLYFWGVCLKNDNAKAEMYWERAALKNHVLAQLLLGMFYIEKNDYFKAITWFKKSAVQGLAESQMAFGICYLYGTGVENNNENAYYWFKKSAEQGYAAAQLKLGDCYRTGIGVEQDYEQAASWYRKAVEQGNEEANNRIDELKNEINCFDDNNINDHIKLNNLAKRGDTLAQCSLGDYYYKGIGVDKDYDQAAYWYRKAAEQGNKEAQFGLGICCYISHDYRQAVDWFRQAAKQGEANAQYHLGFCYQFGTGVDKNNQKAMYWYGKAAEQGNEDAKEQLKTIDNIKNSQTYTFFERYINKAESGDVEAQCKLAMQYFDKEDYVLAVYWFKKAAAQGDKFAQCRLGYCFSAGYGTETNMEKSFYWYEKAAEQGEPEAQYCVGCCYYGGMGVVKNERNAFEWYEKAAYNNHIEAQGALAACYSEGIGTEKNYVKAFEWYKHMAENGDAIGQHKVAVGYFKGIGVKKDEEEAVTWLIKSAKQGNVNAQIDLGFCYKNGHGTLIDNEKALYWCKKAAEQGDEKAQKIVTILEKQNQAIDRNKANDINTNKRDSKENTTISNVPKVMARRNKVQNEEAYFARYKKEAESGNQKSQYELAICYETGKGTTQSEDRAVYWCRKSAIQGNQFAQYRLATYYLKGLGVEYDEKEAIRWLDKAAKQGNKAAEWQLERIRIKRMKKEEQKGKF